MFKDIISSKRIEIKPGAAGVVISEESHDFTNTQGGVMGIRKSLGRKGLILGANLVPADYTGHLELQLYNGGANVVEIMAGERVGNLLVIEKQPVQYLPETQHKYVLCLSDVKNVEENRKLIENTLAPLSTGEVDKMILRWGEGDFITEYVVKLVDGKYSYFAIVLKSRSSETCTLTCLEAVVQVILNDIHIATMEQNRNEK